MDPVPKIRTHLETVALQCNTPNVRFDFWLWSIAGTKSFGIIPTQFIGSVERSSGAKYNPELTNLQCPRKQNLGLRIQGQKLVKGGGDLWCEMRTHFSSRCRKDYTFHAKSAYIHYGRTIYNPISQENTCTTRCFLHYIAEKHTFKSWEMEEMRPFM